MREIILDTETTGLDPEQGHRIIEIGCVEVVDRKLTQRHYHQYINPQREVDEGAIAVHGISNEFLADKPVFAQVAEDFFNFVAGARLVIHNAPFDVGFINHEFQLLGQYGPIEQHCQILDTLAMAREKHPGQKNNLDALCKRYEIDNSHRDLHGALLDAEILADVYLIMTGGQTLLKLGGEDAEGSENPGQAGAGIRRLEAGRPALSVIGANALELEAHEQLLDVLEKSSGQRRWK